ncbi:MAG: hypothetical protein ACKVYV_07255 [Limisphaerales bacterium]
MSLTAARTAILPWLAATLLPARAAEEPAAEATVWLPEVSLRTFTGYRDNVLLSTVAPIGSPLGGLAADASWLGVGPDHSQYTLLATGEYTHFFAADLDPEALALLQAAFKRDAGRWGSFGLGADYVFQDSVFDVSTTEANLTTVDATGHTLTARPAAGLDLHRELRLDAEVEVVRQLFSEPLDDDWEGGMRLKLKWTPAPRSTVTLGGRLRERVFDNRLALDAEGFALDEGLVMHAREVETEWRQGWDAGRRWRTQLRLSLGGNEDNGGGYFDFTRYGARAIARYDAAPWSLRAECRAWYYDYPTQTISGTGSALRRIIEVAAVARAEYRLGDGWSAYVEYVREETDDNTPASDYTVNTGMLGLQYTFE